MTTTTDIIASLNEWEAQHNHADHNIWGDIINELDLDEAAIDRLDPGAASAPFVGLIPTSPSSLYSTFGIDFAIPAVWDRVTGDCVADADFVEWVEVGPFDADDPNACDPNCDSAVRDRLDAAANGAGYWLDWPTYRETAADEYHEVDAYRLSEKAGE